MAAALEIELEVDNEDYYSLLNVRREVRSGFFKESSQWLSSAQNDTGSDSHSLIR